MRNNLTCEETPWLATGATWDGGDKLTLDIREGVKWSDGEDFTAEDVAFTMNLQKEYPGMDKAGLWNDTFGAPASSVEADGNQVVITFEGNAAAKYDGIISTKILPEHVYSEVGDPTTYVDKEPVGTGPFEVESYNGRRLTLARRDDYWQADKIKVEKIVQEGIYDSSQAALKLEAGEIDAYYGDIPNPEKTLVEKDPENNHFFYAPAGTTVLTGNLTKEPWNDPEVPRGDLLRHGQGVDVAEGHLRDHGAGQPDRAQAPRDGGPAPRGVRQRRHRPAVRPRQGGRDARRGRLRGGRGRQAHPARRQPAVGQLLRPGRLHRLRGHRRGRRRQPQRHRAWTPR